MGSLVKRRWCGGAGLAPDRVYHCAVMPCYDKKLEASREDFWLPGAGAALLPATVGAGVDSGGAASSAAASPLRAGCRACNTVRLAAASLFSPRSSHPRAFTLPALASAASLVCAGTQVPETDSVLATTELQELLEQHQVDLHSLPPSPFDPILPEPSSSGAAAASGSSAGGTGNGWHASSSSGGAAQPAPAASAGGSEAGLVPASSASGGYLEHVFRAAAVELFGRQLPPGPLLMRVGRNAGGQGVGLARFLHGCAPRCTCVPAELLLVAAG